MTEYKEFRILMRPQNSDEKWEYTKPAKTPAEAWALHRTMLRPGIPYECHLQARTGRNKPFEDIKH